jgi:RNA polymerase sigma-70 factor, ECF subfamily
MGRAVEAEAQLKELMLAARSGDAAAYRSLLKQVSPHLRAYYGRRLGRGAADAEDLVQETLIALHTKAATYDASQPFTPWLYAIARYKLLDRLRKEKRTPTLALEDAGDLLAHSDHESIAARRDVDKLLKRLPVRTQQLVRDTKLEGLSTAEAAGRSGMSEAAVKVAVHRALRALSSMLPGGTKS